MLCQNMLLPQHQQEFQQEEILPPVFVLQVEEWQRWRKQWKSWGELFWKVSLSYLLHYCSVIATSMDSDITPVAISSDC